MDPQHVSYAVRWQPHQLTTPASGPLPDMADLNHVTTPTGSIRTDLSRNRPLRVADKRVLNFRNKVRVATWNVQTLLRTGYATLLSHELTKYDLSLAGICEVRWPGSGETIVGDHTLIWSGPEDRTGLYGVALAIPSRLRGSLISWKPISDRLLTARLLHTHGKMTVIVAYAPTEVAEDIDKDTFYDQLQEAVLDAPPHDITLVLTDANATLSANARSPTQQDVIGPISVDTTTNDNGNRLLELCRATNLCIADTCN